VRQFPLLHRAQLSGVRRADIQRVPAEVPRAVLRLQLLDVVRAFVRVGPPHLNARALSDPDRQREDEPQRDRNLRDLVDRRTPNLAAKQRVPRLLHQEPKGSKHTHAPVSDLNLA